MVMNSKMRRYLHWEPGADLGDFESLEFVKLGEGYFFEREVNDNLRLVVDLYAKESDSDWAGYEYSANKLHLEDEVDAPIPEIVTSGIKLVLGLADRFKSSFPDRQAVFWLGCDEFGEFPSVTISFYVKRQGMLPILPEDESALDSFAGAILIVV